MQNRLVFFPALMWSANTFAAIAAAANPALKPIAAPAITPVTGLFQIVFGLIAVLAIMAFSAWAFKKIGPITTSNKLPVKVIGGVSVGNREKIMVIEVADQWIVVGVTGSQINTLSTLPKQEQFFSDPIAGSPDQFSTWLKRTIEKRNLAKPK